MTTLLSRLWRWGETKKKYRRGLMGSVREKGETAVWAYGEHGPNLRKPSLEVV